MHRHRLLGCIARGEAQFSKVRLISLSALYPDTIHSNYLFVFRPTLWLLLFQVGTVGATGFIWAIVYIISSPTVRPKIPADTLKRSSMIRSPVHVLLLLPALALGYGIPALVMSLPSSSTSNPPLVSNTFKQHAIVIWNVYPLLVLTALFLLRPILRQILPLSVLRAATPSPNGKGAATTHHLYAIRVTSIIALVLSSIMHLFTVGVSLSTVLFPAIFQPAYIDQLSPTSIFLPPLISDPSKTLTPGDGARGFLLWDQAAGYATILVIIVLELRCAARAVRRSGSASAPLLLSPWILGVGIIIVSLVLGPGSACLAGNWVRDEILFGGLLG